MSVLTPLLLALATILISSIIPTNSVAQETTKAVIAQAAADARLHASSEFIAGLENDGAPANCIVMLRQTRAATTASLATEDGKAASRKANKAELDAFFNRRKALDIGSVTRTFEYMPAFAVTVTAQQLANLLQQSDVASVEEDRVLTAHLRQGIPLENALSTRAAHDGTGIAVAVCDTGIDYGNTYLGGGSFPNAKVIGGRDIGQNKDDPMDRNGHGTACAGIIAGTIADTGDYIGGVAPGAKLYALKISSDATGGSASSAAMIAAWEWAVTHQNNAPTTPIRIISTSFGGGRYTGNAACDAASPGMTAAANNAVSAGITIFASSGNDGYCDSMGWPACISSVISVGAVYDANFGSYSPCVNAASCATKYFSDCSTGYHAIDATAADNVTSYSNSASFLTLFAPSNQAYTLQCSYNSSTFNTSFGGTSAACPYAAGAATALQSAAKTLTGSYLTPAQVRSTLTATGVSVTDSKVAVTKPRVNLLAAIQSLTPATQGVVNLLPLDIPAAVKRQGASSTAAQPQAPEGK